MDVAEVDALGQVRFSELRWPAPSKARDFLPETLKAAFPLNTEDVLVIDGPQALARPGASVREAERLLRAPGRTPDVLPEPGRPFTGFVRGGVLLFAALHARGGHPLLDVDTTRWRRPASSRPSQARRGARWLWRSWGRRRLTRDAREGRRCWRCKAFASRQACFPPMTRWTRRCAHGALPSTWMPRAGCARAASSTCAPLEAPGWTRPQVLHSGGPRRAQRTVFSWCP